MLKVLMFMPTKGWLCKCDCGNEKYVDGNHLRNFKYLSCGCDSRKRQAQSLKRTLQARSQVVKSKPITYIREAVKFPNHGTRCWVCRNKTGTKELVALCKVCSGIQRVA